MIKLTDILKKEAEVEEASDYVIGGAAKSVENIRTALHALAQLMSDPVFTRQVGAVALKDIERVFNHLKTLHRNAL